MRVDRKNRAGNRPTCKGTPDIEFEQDWSVQALRYVRDRKLKTMFLVSRIFSEKADSVILLDFEYTINPQNLNKIVIAIFEKIEIFIFFLCELPLILGVAQKRKKTGRRYLQGDSRYRI